MKHYTVTIEREGIAFPIVPPDTIVRAALRSGVAIPYECNSGGCGACKFELLDGDVENLWPEAPGLTERDRRRNRLLACQCRPRSDLSIRVRPSPEHAPRVRPQRRELALVGVDDITHDIREFRFRTEDAAEFLPGQYAMLDLPGVGSPRAYSMSNIANAEGEWQFQIRRVPQGKGSECLFQRLRHGDTVQMDGPYGVAWLREESKRDIVCAAGGSGLAPMVSIARGSSAAGMLRERQLHFFYGGRTARDICGESLLRSLPEFGSRIHFHPVVSLPSQEGGDAWSGETGFVHDLVRRRLEAGMADFEFYFAGPPPMTQALQEMLMIGHRVPFSQIHFDRFF